MRYLLLGVFALFSFSRVVARDSLLINAGSDYVKPAVPNSAYDARYNYGQEHLTGVMAGGGGMMMPGVQAMGMSGMPGMQVAQNVPYSQSMMTVSPFAAMNPGQASQMGLQAQMAGFASPNPMGAYGTNMGMGSNPYGAHYMQPYSNYSTYPTYPSYNGAAGMAMPQMPIHTSMQQFSQAPLKNPLQKAQENTLTSQSHVMSADYYAQTYRMIKNMNNGMLAQEEKNDLKKYKKDLLHLVGLDDEQLPDSVEQGDLKVQIARVGKAMTDKNSLLANPDSTDLPGLSKREQKRKDLLALIDKWSTPEGISHQSENTRRRSRYSSSYSRTRQSTGSIQAHQAQIDKISDDQRILYRSLKAAQRHEEGDMEEIIEGAIFNTLIAKTQAYDKFMDSIDKKSWKTIVDHGRGIQSSASTQRTSRNTSSRRSRYSSSRTSRYGSTSTQKSTLKKDDLVSLQTQMKGLLKSFEKWEDMSAGDDEGVKAALKVHIQTIDRVLDAIKHPSKPNPFRGMTPTQQEVLDLTKQLASLTNVDLLEKDDADLAKMEAKLLEAIKAPKVNLPIGVKYGAVLNLIDKLARAQALKAYNEGATDFKNLTGGGKGVSGKFKRFRSSLTTAKKKGVMQDTTKLVNHIMHGDFEAGIIVSGTGEVHTSNALALALGLNKRDVEEKHYSQSVDQHNGRTKAAHAALKRLGNLYDKTSKEIMEKGVDLDGTYDALWRYYANGDYQIQPKEKHAEDEEKEHTSSSSNPTQLKSTHILKDEAELGRLLTKINSARFLIFEKENPQKDMTEKSIKSDMEQGIGSLLQAREFLQSNWKTAAEKTILKGYIAHTTKLLDKVLQESREHKEA